VKFIKASNIDSMTEKSKCVLNVLQLFQYKIATGMRAVNAKISLSMAQKAGLDILSLHVLLFICFMGFEDWLRDAAYASEERPPVREVRDEVLNRESIRSYDMVETFLFFTSLKVT
jgi:hypothetical protein